MDEERKWLNLSDNTTRIMTSKTIEEVDGTVIKGKALYCSDSSEIVIVENAPVGPRNKEVARSAHGRCVRRLRDGGFTFTLRFLKDEKYIKETLIAELRDVLKIIDNLQKKEK